MLATFRIEGDGDDQDRFTDHRPIDRGQWLHERWRQRGRMINVGIDAWAFRRVSDAVLGDLLAEGPENRDA